MDCTQYQKYHFFRNFILFSTRYERYRASLSRSYRFLLCPPGDSRGDIGGEEGAVVFSPSFARSSRLDSLRGLHLSFLLGVSGSSSLREWHCSPSSSLLACLAKYSKMSSSFSAELWLKSEGSSTSYSRQVVILTLQESFRLRCPLMSCFCSSSIRIDFECPSTASSDWSSPLKMSECEDGKCEDEEGGASEGLLNWQLYLCCFGARGLCWRSRSKAARSCLSPKSKLPKLILRLRGTSCSLGSLGLLEASRRVEITDSASEPACILPSKKGRVALKFGLRGSLRMSSSSACSSRMTFSLACVQCEMRKSSLRMPILERGLRQSFNFSAGVTPSVRGESSVSMRILARQLMRTVSSQVTFFNSSLLAISRISALSSPKRTRTQLPMLCATCSHSQTSRSPSRRTPSSRTSALLDSISCFRSISLRFSTSAYSLEKHWLSSTRAAGAAPKGYLLFTTCSTRSRTDILFTIYYKIYRQNTKKPSEYPSSTNPPHPAAPLRGQPKINLNWKGASMKRLSLKRAVDMGE